MSRVKKRPGNLPMSLRQTLGAIIETTELFVFSRQVKDYCLIIVVLAVCDGPAPPPKAVALFEREVKVKLAWVML